MLVKICGLKFLDDARLAAAAGADLLGIVVSQSSPRRASENEARAILALDVPQPKYLVFGYDDAEYIRQTFAALAVTGTRLQIMADHPQIEQLLKLAPTELILPSISAAEKVTAVYVSRWDAHPLVLFDSHRKPRNLPEGQIAGGTGKTFDPINITGIKRPYLLAGGLNADNVAGIVAKVNPPGVDVASGTESAPGVKDHDKVKRFILNAKKAAQMIQVQQ
jgi:phosphoribosylanthranilate isomerase